MARPPPRLWVSLAWVLIIGVSWPVISFAQPASNPSPCSLLQDVLRPVGAPATGSSVSCIQASVQPLLVRENSTLGQPDIPLAWAGNYQVGSVLLGPNVTLTITNVALDSVVVLPLKSTSRPLQVATFSLAPGARVEFVNSTLMVPCAVVTQLISDMANDTLAQAGLQMLSSSSVLITSLDGSSLAMRGVTVSCDLNANLAPGEPTLTAYVQDGLQFQNAMAAASELNLMLVVTLLDHVSLAGVRATWPALGYHITQHMTVQGGLGVGPVTVMDLAGVPAFASLSPGTLVRWRDLQLQGLCALRLTLVPQIPLYLWSTNDMWPVFTGDGGPTSARVSKITELFNSVVQNTPQELHAGMFWVHLARPPFPQLLRFAQPLLSSGLLVTPDVAIQSINASAVTYIRNDGPSVGQFNTTAAVNMPVRVQRQGFNPDSMALCVDPSQSLSIKDPVLAANSTTAPLWLPTDGTSFVNALNDAATHIAVTINRGPPSPEPAPPIIMPIGAITVPSDLTGKLIFMQRDVVMYGPGISVSTPVAGNPTTSVLDLQRTTCILRLSDSNLYTNYGFYLARMTLRGLARESLSRGVEGEPTQGPIDAPSNTTQDDFALPLWFVRARINRADGPQLFLTAVTLELPVDEWKSLYFAAARGDAWQRGAGATHPLIQGLTVFTVGWARYSAAGVHVAALQGWGLNATNLLLVPEEAVDEAELVLPDQPGAGGSDGSGGSGGDGTMSPGVIAGAVVGAAVGIALITAAVVMGYRTHRARRALSDVDGEICVTGGPGGKPGPGTKDVSLAVGPSHNMSQSNKAAAAACAAGLAGSQGSSLTGCETGLRGHTGDLGDGSSTPTGLGLGPALSGRTDIEAPPPQDLSCVGGVGGAAGRVHSAMTPQEVKGVLHVRGSKEPGSAPADLPALLPPSVPEAPIGALGQGNGVDRGPSFARPSGGTSDSGGAAPGSVAFAAPVTLSLAPPGPTCGGAAVPSQVCDPVGVSVVVPGAPAPPLGSVSDATTGRPGVAGSTDDSAPGGAGQGSSRAASTQPGSADSASKWDPKKEVAALAQDLQADGDKIQLLETIGQGGFGAVFRGKWRGLEVAVKTVLFSEDGGLGAQQRAVMEAAVCTSVAHPNVVATYHYDIMPVGSTAGAVGPGGLVVEDMTRGNGASGATNTDWKLFLVQEYCHASLYTVLSRKLMHPQGQPDMDLILTTLLDIAHGMCYLHSKNVVHGDLKPENVLLKNDSAAVIGVVSKIIDFGLSRSLDPSATHISNVTNGTPFYSAPEVVRKGQIHKASDVYSFGVLMWEMYLATPPWIKTREGYKANGRFPKFPPSAPEVYVKLARRCLDVNGRTRPDFPSLTTQLASMHAAFLDGYDSLSRPAALPTPGHALPAMQPLAWDPSVMGSGAAGTPLGALVAGPAPHPGQPMFMPQGFNPLGGPPQQPQRPQALHHHQQQQQQQQAAVNPAAVLAAASAAVRGASAPTHHHAAAMLAAQHAVLAQHAQHAPWGGHMLPGLPGLHGVPLPFVMPGGMTALAPGGDPQGNYGGLQHMLPAPGVPPVHVPFAAPTAARPVPDALLQPGGPDHVTAAASGHEATLGGAAPPAMHRLDQDSEDGSDFSEDLGDEVQGTASCALHEVAEGACPRAPPSSRHDPSLRSQQFMAMLRAAEEEAPATGDRACAAP